LILLSLFRIVSNIESTDLGKFCFLTDRILRLKTKYRSKQQNALILWLGFFSRRVFGELSIEFGLFQIFVLVFNRFILFQNNFALSRFTAKRDWHFLFATVRKTLAHCCAADVRILVFIELATELEH
jgi:hypothetical protein